MISLYSANESSNAYLGKDVLNGIDRREQIDSDNKVVVRLEIYCDRINDTILPTSASV
jgi:hypothetical protein